MSLGDRRDNGTDSDRKGDCGGMRETTDRDGIGDGSARSKRAILAHIRHELRTPINAVIGYSEMLLEDESAAGNAARVRDLRSIREAAGEILGQVAEVLDADRIQRRSNIDLAEYTQTIRHALRVPINSIIGYSELLMEDAAVEHADGLLADLGRIRSAGQRLLQCLGEIVSATGLTLGDAALDREVHGSAEITETLDSISPLSPSERTCQDGQGGRILVVDDNRVNRDLLKRMLERDGHSVELAENGKVALERLRTECFDVLLSDIVMPEMNGYRLLSEVKKDESLRHLPVVMLSSLDETDTIVRCIERGAEDYIPKPFNPVVLKARIGACLETKRLRDREREYLRQLHEEREKSERLLLNILPGTIANRLKENEGVIADTFPEVTVLFADLVGFTRMTMDMPPEALVAMLNEVFSSFDRLASRHGLEKIKTIGDSYMAVAGVPTPRPDHATAVCDCALDMVGEIAALRERGPIDARIRIGVNSGPVVAGVIGTRKFIYDLWGDTVNTASRMESHGMPDRIQISAATRRLLPDNYQVERREPIDVKGKGVMETWFLLGRRPA